VSGTQPGGRCCDADIEVDHFDRQAPPEIVDELDRFVTSPCRADETFGERRGCHSEPVPLVERLADDRASRLMMGIVAIQEPDQHTGIEVDQRHSSRSSSSSPAA